MHEAKLSDAKEVVLWGSGKPKREFLYVDDLANALVFLATLDDQRFDALVVPTQCPLINIGTGADLTIRELAETIAAVIGYRGRFVQDTSKPDGTMRKVMDVSKIDGLGWKATTSLQQGIAQTYRIFCETQS
jgi:GDP-L-fucose synthase